MSIIDPQAAALARELRQNPGGRPAAAAALAALGDGAIPEAAAFSRSVDRDLRLWAAWILARLAHGDAIPLLARLAVDDDREVRRTAVSELARLDAPACTAPLVAALGDVDVANRLEAAQALGASRDPAAVEALCLSLADADADVCSRAARALGRLGNSSAVPSLLRRLTHTTSRGRLQRDVVTALGEIGDARAVAPLIQLLTDGGSVARSASQALAGIGAPAVAGLCARIKEHPLAIVALGEIGEPAVEPLLDIIRSGHDHEARLAAARTLMEIAAHSPCPELLQAIPALKKRLGFFTLERADSIAVYREALGRIKTATDYLADVPVPAEAGSSATAELPIPAGLGAPSAAELPIPAERPH